MNKISLTSSKFTNCIILPNVFIDEYMPSANGSYVKVYLYLVRCMQNLQSDITIPAIADKLENTENDILRAIAYWEKVGLLTLEKDERNQITALTLADLSTLDNSKDADMANDEIAVATESIADAELANTKFTDTKEVNQEFMKPHYTETQINQITSDDEVKWMMSIIEVYLEHPLRPVDIQLIMYLYESLNFSRELIMYLYEYCISKGKKNASYIEAVALSWAKEGIDTVEKAEANATLYNTNYSAVSKAFGLNRTPGAVEQQYINKWMTKYKLSIEIIVEACNRTLLATGKPDFKYADKILEKWYAKGVKTQKDVERLDEEHKKNTSEKLAASTTRKTTATKPTTNKFNAFPQREYSQADYSDLEQKLMNLDYFTKND